MITTLPTLKKEFIDGEVVRHEGKLTVEIDTSVLAHLKWEEPLMLELKHFADCILKVCQIVQN